ncbi:MAG: DNRLRE domain-containing protein [Niastella sp.]|uniref:DNRLRE domain-containing protein n=1 Tax=Niastella sp. TaxID=1869183 RepID=UPI00389A89E9
MTRARYLLAAFVLVLSVASCKKDVDNKVPVADAGPSQIITLPDSAKVKVTATDEGKIVAYSWSQVSGPNHANILNPGADSTAIVFSVPGNYLFQVMATDNEGASGVDTVSILVNAIEIKTLTLQPANNPYEFNLAALRPITGDIDQSYAPTYDLPLMTWPKNNVWYDVRPMIKFDLSGIPANSTIVTANLYLYSYPSPTMSGNGIDANSGPDNSFSPRMITANWSPSTVNWNNQPSSTSVTASAENTRVPQVDLNFDVTGAISFMYRNNANYGFLLQFNNANPYNNSRIFVSSHNPNPSLASKFPKLVVVYKRAN